MDIRDVTLRPIGVVRTTATDNEIREAADETVSTIEIYPEFEEGLQGLDGSSHIFVLTYMNKLRPDQIGPLKVRPRRLLRKGFKLEQLPLVGVFAVDSPTRPNPIGLTLVKLLRIDGRNLVVEGLDCFDRTPVLDIKPYKERYSVEHFNYPDWYSRLREIAGGDI